jgi:hypothetical protein
VARASRRCRSSGVAAAFIAAIGAALVIQAISLRALGASTFGPATDVGELVSSRLAPPRSKLGASSGTGSLAPAPAREEDNDVASGDGGEVSSVLVGADGSSSVAMRSGTVARFVARGPFTGGRFGLFRWEMPGRSGGASPHFHRTFSESFYILSGSVSLFSGQDWVLGRFASRTSGCRPGVCHTGSWPSTAPQ